MARSPILLIDDNADNLNLLERILEWAGYLNVHKCQSAPQGLQKISLIQPFLIILDLSMPGMDGYEFLKRIQENPPTNSLLPILVFTSDLTKEAKTRALQLGASDFLTKPGDAYEIQLRVRNFLQMRKMHSDLLHHNELLEAKVTQRTEHLLVARREAVQVLARTCEFRDDETGNHCRRVGELSAGIAQALDLDEEFVESIRLAAPLHDLGKVAVPDAILRKPGPLTEEESTLIKRHPTIGAELLDDVTSPLLQLAREVSKYHHERWDGTGYHEGLSGEAIPISARIVAVADTFDAITNDRPYRIARSEEEALQELTTAAGTQFDPSIVAALKVHLEAPPVAEESASESADEAVTPQDTRLTRRTAA
jgi:putative two-component system response regulator